MNAKNASTLNSLPTKHEGSPPEPRRAWGGLLRRRECWTLSRRGWLLVLALAAGLLFGARYGVHPFLAVTDRTPADLLVIEGWSPPNTMRQAASEFLHGGYQRVLLVRPILDKGDKYESGRYSGDFMSQMLLSDGVPKDKLATLFPNVARKDRTFHSALAVKQWLGRQKMDLKSLDIATEGPHARRSRLMYQKAFGDGVTVGVIALDSHEYDPTHWWRTSEGVREVLGESIAYLYARFLFRPSASSGDRGP